VIAAEPARRQGREGPIKRLLRSIWEDRAVFQVKLPKLPALAELDPVALDTRKLGRPRVIAAAITASLLGMTSSWTLALSWGGAVVACEAWIWISTLPHARGRTVRRLDRLAFMAAAICSAFAWLSLSVLFWMTPQHGSQFIALLIWACLLLNAISFAYRSSVALLMFGVPVGLVMIATPIIWPMFGGSRQTMIDVGLVIFVLYAGLSARRSVIAAQALAQTSLELERQRETAETANAAKSAFLATISHEIRTPLNGVLGMAQAMARDDLPEVQRDRLGVIRTAGESLLGLLNDLLDLSRIESGRMELEDGVIDMEELARNTQATFAAVASEKDVLLVVTVRPEARGLWRGDPTRVRQILYNLISNAVKFTAAGAVQAFISHDGRNLVMEVVDTGPGIAPDRLGALFEKFVQEDASTTRRYGGSGLGLSICRDLATLMHGEVDATSEVGKGSTFTVRLPLVRAVEAPETEAEEAAPLELSRLRILAAEDNATNQLVLKTLLTQLGITVEAVENGALAVEASAAGGWDLILMDVQMPVMDGPTATRLIRAREAAQGAPRTPILALTANAMAHQAEEYIAAGMDGAVAKPIQLDQLIAAMQAVLRPAKAEASARRKAS
jgi:signal transduction histidine kinase/AmiR/NasT family two-component response regulator